MGMDTYLLVKMGKQELSAATQKRLVHNPETLERAYAVQNIEKPALLIATQINWNDSISWEREELLEYILHIVDKEILLKNTCREGLLLFADGGEPFTSWPRRSNFEKLIETITSTAPKDRLYRWVSYTAAEVEKICSDLPAEEKSTVTREEWREAFMGWLTAVAGLVSSKDCPARKKTWWEVSDYYFTSLELEEGLQEVLTRGFLSKDELEKMKKFDKKFRNFIPENHDAKVGHLAEKQWEEICAEAHYLLQLLKPGWS